MARYYLYFFMLLTGMGFFCSAQAQVPAVQQVIGAGGGSNTIGRLTIDFTVGEAVIATAGSDPSCTEGLHQPLTARDFPDSNLNNASWYIKVYPNPVNDLLTIHTYMDQAGNLDCRVVDIMGRVMLIRPLSFQQGYNDVTLNLSGLAKGIYILYITDPIHGGVRLVKLLKN